MKKHSAPSLHLLAATTFANTTAAMSSSQPFRGGRSRGRGRGRGRRNFSDHPSGEGNEQDIVTGDSHFNSVRQTNRNFRPRAPMPNIRPNQQIYGQLPPPQPFNHNQQSYRAVAPPPGLYQNQQFNRAPQYLRNHQFNRPNYYDNQQFNRPNYGNQQFNRPDYENQQFNRPNFYDNQQFNRPNVYENQQFNRPNFHGNQQFRPRPLPPKALNFRNWEYARPGPPPHCEQFTVLSYNILADYLAIDHQRKLYFHIPQHILDWEWRKRSILSELGWWSADILCLQEVDRFQELEAELKLRGYSGIWKRRTGDPADGCAIFWNTSRFKLVHEEFIEFKKFGLRDNVAQICVFESLGQQSKSSPAPSASPGDSNKVVICNTHVLFNPRRGEIKLGQVRVLLDKAYGVSKLWDNAPIVICGDFNSTPKSPLYNYIAEERLDLSEVPRDKVSGQESATINTVKRSSLNASARHQDAVNSSRSSTVASERGVKDSKMALDVQKLDTPEKDSGTGSSACTLSQPQSSVVYKPGSSCMVTSCSDSTNDLPREIHVEGTSDEASSLESCQEDEYDKDSESGYNNASPNATSSSSHQNFEAEVRTRTDSYGEKDGQSKVGDFGSENVVSIQRPTIAHCSDVSSTGQFSDSSNAHEVSLLESSGSVLSIGKESSPKASLELKNSYTESCFGVLLDEKMDNLSLNVVSEGTKEDELLGENRDTFLSQLHGEAGSFPSDSNQFQTTALEEMDESLKKYDGSLELRPLSEAIADDAPDLETEVVDGERFSYDPSAWTPMDIETATGYADCTVMEHNLKLTSAYREVELQDFSGTRDSTGEPEVTSYHRLFMGTVDYIWRSEGLQTARVLAPIPKNAMQFVRGFPTKKWGSDHIALVSEFAFTNDLSAQDTSGQKQ
ncbi:carbon catabolite repressor protein 4 homolog 6 isoform X1 [Lycium barbarum]|uniref:carbon catabolite repressor protein 4 homolog 6 isoform X1 n=2 Tax=Lycium barbarum TaxID=112863 RepID=UPI00293F5B91|nr:carbon catabolite repressor protein 4 homolog 6 isoform X1 [Lycium barbarum]